MMVDPIKRLYERMTHLALEKISGHRSPPLRFRASEADGCLREIWYRLSGYRPKPRTAVNEMYSILGDIDHDVTRQLMDAYSIPIGGVTHAEDGSVEENMLVRKTFSVPHPELPDVTTEIEVTSRADGRYDASEDNPAMLVEIKGVGFYKYDWLNTAYKDGYKDSRGRKYPPGTEAALARVKEKHPDWYAQMQVTMALSGFDKCYLIVKDRSTGTLGFWNEETDERSGLVVPFDVEKFQEILARFAFIQRRVRSGEIPKAEYPAKSQKCSYCDFRYLCHGADERRQKGLTPAVLYPGPQMEEHHDGAAEAVDRGDQREDA